MPRGGWPRRARRPRYSGNGPRILSTGTRADTGEPPRAMAKFFNLNEAAEALGITPDCLQSWIAEGRASATRRSGQWMLREFEVRKLKKSLPVGRPAPAAEGRALEPDPPPTDPDPGAGAPEPGAARAAGPEGPLTAETRPAAGAPATAEGASGAPAPPLRPPPPPGQVFHERRRVPGRRRDDQLLPSVLLESISQNLEPLATSQARILELLQRSENRQAVALESAMNDLRAALETQGAGVVQAISAEVSVLRDLAAEPAALPPGDAEVARGLEGLRQELEGLRLELARGGSDRDSADVVRLREERDRAVRERDLLRPERERLVDELARARADAESLSRTQEEALGERDRLLKERDRLQASMERSSRQGEADTSGRQRLEADLEDLRRQRAVLQAERDQALAELAGLRSERERPAPETVTHETRTELTDLTRRLEALRKPLDAAGARPAELAERAARVLEESRGQRQQLEARLRASDSEIKVLQDRLRDVMERTQPLAGDLTSTQQALDEARAETSRALTERDALQAALEEERRRRAEEVERRQRESRDLEKSLLKVEGERTRLLQKQTALDAEMAALRAALKAGEGTREEESRVSPEGTARLQGRINGLQRELDASQRQLAEAREAQARAAAEREATSERLRDLQEQVKALNYKMSVGGRTSGGGDSRDLEAEVARLVAETAEKDNLIQDGHRERAEMRMELEKAQRAFYELQQRVERERKEWSEILAREIKQREDAQRPPAAGEEEPARRSSGWRLFRPRGGG